VAEIIKASGKKYIKRKSLIEEFIFANRCWLAKIRKRTNRIFRFKGDKLVGNYYVVFDKAYKEEIAQLMSAGKTEEEAKNNPIILEAQDMLLKWESGDESVLSLHESMGV
jgi:arginyl-tRNA synthetase